VIVGETTFGKGLIQTIVELSDGSGVAVTVARYQTPDGTDINKTGIRPDIFIDPGMRMRMRAMNKEGESKTSSSQLYKRGNWVDGGSKQLPDSETD
jgi:C-terminal processing protease CtpA/Prc